MFGLFHEIIMSELKYGSTGKISVVRKFFTLRWGVSDRSSTNVTKIDWFCSTNMSRELKVF